MAKRVLVADDSATIQKAFSMVLGGLQDSISLVAARSFDDAVTAARQSRPDLVIADIVLGNRTGYDLCAALKADPALRGVPVYILGSSQTPYDEARGRQAGADGHLLKPFESQSLIDRVQEALARPAAAVPAARPELSPPPIAAAARPVGARPAVATVAPDDEDEYGEFTIERSSGGQVVPVPPAAPVLAAPSPPVATAAAPRPTPPPAPVSPFAPATSAAPAASAGSGAALRPSLIPGARPAPAARPQVAVASASVAPPTATAHRPVSPPALPKRPEAVADAAFHAKRSDPPPDPGFHAKPLGDAGLSGPAAHAGIGRTIMGLPAVAIPGPLGAPREARPAPPAVVPSPPPPAPPPPSPPTPPVVSSPPPMAPAPPPAPVAAAVAPAVVPLSPSPTPPIASISAARPAPAASAGPFPLASVAGGDSASALSARIDQKVAAIAARGPEYEAVAKLSREVIEQVVWEVVPELAEAIIREHVERLASARK